MNNNGVYNFKNPFLGSSYSAGHSIVIDLFGPYYIAANEEFQTDHVILDEDDLAYMAKILGFKLVKEENIDDK